MFGPSEATLDFLRDIRAADDRQWRLESPDARLTAPSTYHVTHTAPAFVPQFQHEPARVSINWPQAHGCPMGWQCPGCGWCFAPGMPSCSNCNRPEHLKTSTGTSVQVETGCPSDTELAAALAVLRKRRYTPEELQALITEAWRVDVESAGP